MQGLKIVILGPQGSGKGTQAGLLARHFHIPHISAGDLLRAEARRRSGLGKRIAKIIDGGRLVPDSLIGAAVRRRLKEADAKHGWILDGYPRFKAQAKTFGRFAKPTLILHLQLSDRQAIKRLAGRLVCPRGHIYHIEHDRPKRRGRCDHDGLPLRQRDDDTPAAIRKRLRWHHAQTDPLIAIYRRQGLVRDVDASPRIHDVFQATLQVLTECAWLSSPSRKTSRR